MLWFQFVDCAVIAYSLLSISKQFNNVFLRGARSHFEDSTCKYKHQLHVFVNCVAYDVDGLCHLLSSTSTINIFKHN